MSRTLTLSDALYERLEGAAQMRGLSTIVDLLEEVSVQADELRRRRDVVRRIDALRERLHGRYGEMGDSTDLIRQDRSR